MINIENYATANNNDLWFAEKKRVIISKSHLPSLKPKLNTSRLSDVQQIDKKRFSLLNSNSSLSSLCSSLNADSL